MFKIIIYLIITLTILHFTLYYFNFDVFDYNIFNSNNQKNQTLFLENIIPEINASINELKTLNEYINNGKINTSFS
jgi:hypothetical protein